jgi:hypothetical protein
MRNWFGRNNLGEKERLRALGVPPDDRAAEVRRKMLQQLWERHRKWPARQGDSVLPVEHPEWQDSTNPMPED